MSADNGIYILETKHPKNPNKYEYRVAHLQAVDNVDWDENLKKYTDDPDIIIKNARNMWGGCHVFTSKTKALEAAAKIEQETTILEYGISFIRIDRVFSEK